jgi:hypothetical protein
VTQDLAGGQGNTELKSNLLKRTKQRTLQYLAKLFSPPSASVSPCARPGRADIQRAILSGRNFKKISAPVRGGRVKATLPGVCQDLLGRNKQTKENIGASKYEK